VGTDVATLQGRSTAVGNDGRQTRWGWNRPSMSRTGQDRQPERLKWDWNQTEAGTKRLEVGTSTKHPRRGARRL